MDDIFKLCDRIREIAYSIHVHLGCGHFERIYERALAHRLTLAGIQCQQQYAMSVFDADGTVLGDYYADMLVENRLIIEIKVVSVLGYEHRAQLLGYLRASRIEHGLLINFGASRFEI